MRACRQGRWHDIASQTVFSLQTSVLNPLVLPLTLLLRLTAESTIGVAALPFLPLFLLGDCSSPESLGMASSISLVITGSELSRPQGSDL